MNLTILCQDAMQVRLCLLRKDFTRAQILIRKVSPRAFVERPEKKGQNAGEVGIEGTTIEAPDEVSTGSAEEGSSPVRCLAHCAAVCG